MPHIILEHSDNIDIDFEAFFKTLKEKLLPTGAVQEVGIKCRALSSTADYIVDGNPKYKMVNLLFRLREGRPKEVKKSIAEIGMNTLELFFQSEIEKKEIILSTEVKELIKGIDLTKNTIR